MKRRQTNELKQAKKRIAQDVRKRYANHITNPSINEREREREREKENLFS